MTINVDTQTVVVFDLDDTLYYEMDFLISAYKSIARSIDIDNEKMIFSVMFSMYRNKADVFGYLSEKYNTPKKYFLELYRNHIPNITLNEGVINLINKIKNKGGKIGIITDGRALTQKNKIVALGLNKYVDEVVISENIGAEKPSDKAFAYIENQLKAKKYYYIGDNFSKDFIAPKKLNWDTIGVIDCGKNIHSNVYLHHEEIYKCPNHLVYSIKEIKIK